MTSVDERMTELSARTDAVPVRPAGERDLAELERTAGARLPAAYRIFLLRYGGATFDRTVSMPLPAGCSWGERAELDYFFGFSDSTAHDLVDAATTYAGRIPDETIPIATDPGGNLVLLGVQGSVNGRVFFWDHERRTSADELDRMLDELEAAGVDVRRLDADGVVHEWERLGTGRAADPYAAACLVADTFEAFLDSLQPGPITSG